MMKSTLIVLLIAWLAETATPPRPKTCDFPGGEKGSCVPIHECPIIQELAAQRDQLGVEDILNKLVCGRSPGRDVSVCCPKVTNNSVNDIGGLMGKGQQTSTEAIPSTKSPISTTIRTTRTKPSFPKTTQPPTMSRVTTLKTTIMGDRFEIPQLDTSPTAQWNSTVFPGPGVCGKPNPHQYSVIGRKHAAYGKYQGSWPWMAALGFERKQSLYPEFLYAGTLITNRHILTASRVVHQEKLVTARLGVVDLNEFNPSRIDVAVVKVILNEEFNPTTLMNDIAIAVLESPIIFTDTIRPICLPLSPILRSKPYSNSYLRVAGWGSSQRGEPSLLKEAIIPVVTEEDCRQVYHAIENSYIDSKVICAGYLDGGVDACRGDFGGPLMDKDDTQEVYLVGVLSYGGRCLLPGFPGVFTRISSFTDWIVRKVEETM